MEKILSNIFKTKNVTKSIKAILKSCYRVLQESICIISCIIFKEKYFSGYILLTDPIPLSACLYFIRYIGQYVYCNCLLTRLDVINFEINLLFLIKPFSLHDQKVKTKSLNILRTKRAFKIKQKHFLSIFKGLAIKEEFSVISQKLKGPPF